MPRTKNPDGMQSEQLHLRMSERLYELLRDRAANTRQTMNGVVIEVLGEALMEPCPTCHGSGRIVPTDNNQKAPAPVRRPRARPLKEVNHEQHQPAYPEQ